LDNTKSQISVARIYGLSVGVFFSDKTRILFLVTLLLTLSEFYFFYKLIMSVYNGVTNKNIRALPEKTSTAIEILLLSKILVKIGLNYDSIWGLCNITPYHDLPRPTKLRPTKLINQKNTGLIW
jgi:hypothetical protein